MPRRLRAPTTRGIVDVDVLQTPHMAPGRLAFARRWRERTQILMRPEIAEGLRRGDPRALHVALHECGHVVLHQAELAGDVVASRKTEDEADLFAAFVAGVIE